MAKAKSKAGASIPLKHVHSRVSYLYQAASYLSNTTSTRAETHQDDTVCSQSNGGVDSVAAAAVPSRQARHLIGQIRGMSRKTSVRVGPEIKHSVCKRCDALLVPGRTSTCYIENTSVGSAKPWADVLVVRCNACQTTKRFPVGQDRVRRRQSRAKTNEITGSVPKTKQKTGDATLSTVKN